MRSSLLSLGAAVAARPLARSIRSFTADDALAIVGLERNRSRTLERIALVGLGAVAGAGAALLFAPASGNETRRKLKDGAENLAKDATELGKKMVREAQDMGEKAVSSTHELRSEGNNERRHGMGAH